MRQCGTMLDLVTRTLLFLSMLQPAAQEIPVARSHNNETPSGQWSGDTLNVSLELREARVFAEAADGPSVVVPTFGTSDGPPEVPGPLLRVTTGQSIHVTLRNRLAATASVHGFRSRGTPDTPIEIPAGETREATFLVNEPGLFLYWATTGKGASLEDRDGRDGLLNGVIRADGPAEQVREQSILLVQRMAAKGPPTLPEKLNAELWLVNGKMWPFGKEFEHAEGEPIVWRWINASYEPHPMHLHGSYFEVLAKGGQERETRFHGADVARVATESMAPGEGFLMRWQPPHPGNWLFHCHIVFHTGPGNGVWSDDNETSIGHEHTHMSGLVVGTRVRPAAAARSSRAPAARTLTLDVTETGELYPKVDFYGVLPKLAYSTGQIVLRRGEPVAITIRNRMKNATTVHWHGIELESYFDGVAGFGGRGSEVTPEIAPGGSFVARFTPPRAGTFIFHTHMHDFAQLSAGLYGALIVLPAARALDRETDHVFLVSRDGPDDAKAPFVIGGSRNPPPLQLTAGRRHRLRFINITPAHPRAISLLRDGVLQQWRVIAKDGMDLPAARAKTEPATMVFSPGETFDVEFTASGAGAIELVVKDPGPQADPLEVRQSIVISTKP